MIIGGYIPERMLYFRWRTACRMPLVWAADQGFCTMLAWLTYPPFALTHPMCSYLTLNALEAESLKSFVGST